MTLFGGLPPSVLPMLVAVRMKVDMPKTADRKLLRVVNYLIQLAAGEGSAGTVVPFSTLTGSSMPVCATDTFEYEALETLWADVKSESATHYQRAAGFRTLAALSKSSLTSDPDDLTLVSALMAAVATTLDRCEVAKRRKLPFIGTNKKTRELDRRQALERVAAQRVALAAARVGLPGFVLSSKIAPRAFGGVNSPDSLCARHAMAVAALAARDMPGMYVDQLAQLVTNSLEIYRTTGSLTGAELAAEIAAAAQPGVPAPLRPTKELYQEKSLNLTDAWARVYLARGCGAVVHSGVGNVGPFWEMLIVLACSDKSTIVALEAIKALAGASYPTTAAVATLGSNTVAAARRPPLLPDENAEVDARVKFSMAWQLLLAHAEDDAPGAPQAAVAAQAAPSAPAASNRQFTISRSQRASQESAALRRLASLGHSAGSINMCGSSNTLFSAIVSRLLLCLSQMSHAASCSATRAVAVLAESRAHAIAAARTPADRAAVMGDLEVQQLMGLLEERMLAIASDTGFSAHQREKALEALLWFTQLPLRKGYDPLLSSQQALQWMSLGGGTVSHVVRAVFADPWPEDPMAAFMLAIGRRLLSVPSAAGYLLGCASAVVSAAPSRVRQEQLHALWDVCLRANNASIKLAGLQAALAVMSAPTPAIAAPPSAAAPEVKALASREEAAMVAHARSAAWWLGENGNFGVGEYAWQPQPLPAELVQQLETADSCSQGRMATAAVAANPVLCMLIARLQRVMLTGLWEVRIAAAQALAKIAVRSGEPFRVQCYCILAAAAPGSILHRNHSNDSTSPRPNGSNSNAASQGGAALMQAATAAASVDSAAADPLGVAAVVGPALEVLDHVYAGELVVEQLLHKYGPKRSAWPKKLLKTLEKRNAALVGAICERVCYVPKEHFWPLGNAAKELITGKDEDSEARKKKKKQQKGTDEAAEIAADVTAADTATAGGSAADVEDEGQPVRRRYAGSSDEEESTTVLERSKTMLDKLQGYDYDPAAQPADDEEPYPDDSVSQVGYGDEDPYGDTGVGSDDESDIVLRRGVVLYDFTPEEEDEVQVRKGEAVDVDYEVGGWLQIIKHDGSRGLVPKSYVNVAEDDEDDSDAFSLAGRSSTTSGQQSQADYNSFLARSSMRLRQSRVSTTDSEASSVKPRQRTTSRQRDRDEEVGDEPVDAAMMARMVALVAQQGGEVDRTLEQVDEMDAMTRSSGVYGFNRPQYLNLKESLNAILTHLNQLQLSGDARAMRRQMRERVQAGLRRLEALHRDVQVAEEGSGGLSRQVSMAAGAAAPDDGYQYQPTKVHAVYAFDAEAEGELSIAVGDSLWVEAEVDGWYQVVRDGDGARGLVPTSYVDAEQG
eukprot:GHRR01023753.1.p1 GENE.GHRR01023753.1~~GHRR01023753.1.p1  ORF type:complete len:1357 (+),score=559.90 GHRR01023753.1:692-4762(+)